MVDKKSILRKKGWVEYEKDIRKVFNIPKVEVQADTSIFGKEEREDLEGFIFVSNLKFSSDIPSTGLKLLRGLIDSQSKSKFKEVLRERQMQDVSVEKEKNLSNKGISIKNTVFSAYTEKGDKIVSQIYVFHDGESYHIIGYADYVNLDDNYHPRQTAEQLVEEITSG